MDTPPSATCEFCPGGPTIIRLSTMPPYGLNLETGKPYLISQFRPEDHSPESLIEVCDEHEFARWHNGQVLLPPVPQQGRQKAEKKARENLTHSLRGQIIEKLGNKCHTCGIKAPAEQMRVLTPGRSGLATSTNEWLAMVLNNQALLDRTRLGCLEHSGSSGAPSSATGDQVVAAYGGKCAKCGETEGLWVVRLPGTPALLRPNGRRYSSKAKRAALVRAGFPSGWELRCPEHGTLG